MDENIGSIVTTEEAVSLGVVEPLDGAFQTFHVRPLFPRVSQQTAIPKGPRKCVGIVLLLGEAVKDLHHNARGAWHGEARTFNSKARQEPLPLRALRYTKEELVG